MIGGYVRLGLSSEGVALFREMQVAGVVPDEVTMVCFLSACIDLGALELGKWLEAYIERENVSKSDVLWNALIDMFAKCGDVDKALSLFRKKSQWNIVSWTSVIDGDKSHSEYKIIYKMVDDIGKEIRRAGYAASTSEVLLDIDEENKEGAVNRHREKLAIAFSLMNTPPGTPIRIVKNLRVCEDCHSATKFISKTYKREILFRDRNRFHRFIDGVCSCKDFW
ncbi:hypothetical protein K7X08_004628 [Anisodus acutangulus]|uniref:DYW domain-containing protein n=1 Tax=Anisodus acutangulus TaxID=402998 RepID=A0A9Q1RHZ8_9SOLA|nr:hypothetical protein K7X08_004628 [Anisodus acutangulus]